MKSETIAAIATPLSVSGIGIIRISGDDAGLIVDKVFRNKAGKRKIAQVKSHTVHYGYIVNSDLPDWTNYIIDEVIVIVMNAPNSFTKENTVEINCHGGVLVMQKILAAVLENGARLADPGEFTKRAFLNGRIDLTKAEAVIDIIHSQNEYALRSSVDQLKGSLSAEVKSLREEILYQIAFIESALDDPEHISLEGYQEELAEKVNVIRYRIEKLLATADNGRMLREGINTVIVGKPNAGKSSLLNVLVGEERAIVTDVAGTTRDTLQEHIRLNGIDLNVYDTAGIRATEDVVERIGVERARKYAAEADLIIYVVDSSIPLDENDSDIISFIQDKKVIILMNKSDLHDPEGSSGKKTEMYEELAGKFPSEIDIITVSTKEQTGMDLLEKAIMKMFFQGEITFNNQVVITNMRHKEAFSDAYNNLELVKESLEKGMPEDFYSIDLMSAYTSLGTIIGEEVDDDLVNEIFSKFCMGK